MVGVVKEVSRTGEGNDTREGGRKRRKGNEEGKRRKDKKKEMCEKGKRKEKKTQNYQSVPPSLSPSVPLSPASTGCCALN